MRAEDKTDIGGIQEAFLTTHWSLVDSIDTSNDADKNRGLVGLLLKRYWKPAYCYLRRKGYDNEEAKDLTQGFFHEVVLGRQLIEKADRSKGRFRSYLLVALNNYISTVHAAQTAQKRMPEGRLIPLDMTDPPDFCRVVRGYTPEESFDYVWVSALLEQVLEDVETTCCGEGKTVHWRVFRERVLAPITNGTDPPSLGEICHKYDIESPRVASNMIITIKRRFQAILRKHLSETVTSDSEIEDELAEISRFLPQMAQYEK
jgi:RNA polymerase sigma-70 factor (ECF subfamily)